MASYLCYLHLGFASVSCKMWMLITNSERRPLETVVLVVEDFSNWYGDKLY